MKDEVRTRITRPITRINYEELSNFYYSGYLPVLRHYDRIGFPFISSIKAVKKWRAQMMDLEGYLYPNYPTYYPNR